MKTISQIFAETLRDLGIQYVFGIPSGSMIDYLEAIRKTPGIEFVLVSHEACAGFMAAVCGRLTRIPGACFATFGPGATNVSTGVGAAFLDRSPVLVFTDDMPAGKRDRTIQMHIDLQALFAPLTKWTTRLEPGDIRKQLSTAARISCTGLPGPVYIGVPSNISGLENNAHPGSAELHCQIPAAPPEVINAMQKAVLLSDKPLVVLGLTAVLSGLQPLILAMVEKLNLPVVLTPMAKGLVPEDHPLYTGVLNHALAHMVGRTHQQADLILGFGYDPVEVNYEDWVPDAPIVHISTVPADLDTDRYRLAADVVGDLETSLHALMALPGLKHTWDLDGVALQKGKMFAALTAQKNAFGPLAVLEGLRAILPQDGILTCDVGAHLHLIGQKWQTPSPDCLIMTNGWSSMGFGIPAAMAAKLCCPKRAVACVVGDGGFLMAAGEMATALRLGLHIIFIILSDRALSLIRIKQDHKCHTAGYGTSLMGKKVLDSDSFLGVPVWTVSDQDSYDLALKKAFSLSGPVIIQADIKRLEYDTLVLKGNK